MLGGAMGDGPFPVELAVDPGTRTRSGLKVPLPNPLSLFGDPQTLRLGTAGQLNLSGLGPLPFQDPDCFESWPWDILLVG